MAPVPPTLTSYAPVCAGSHAVRPSERFTLADATPYLSVVIVNFCQWRNTARLIRQLNEAECSRSSRSEIVIVDNHSPSHPILGNLRRSHGVSVRRFGRNRGFSRAVNEGCRLGQGEWVLLLNPDMSVPPGFLDEVEERANQLESASVPVGIVGFGLLNNDGSPQASSGELPTLKKSLLRLCLPRAYRKGRPVRAEQSISVPWVTGCCLLIRRQCLEELGGLDEDFFLYYEDVDFCLRARQHGWDVRMDPTLQVIHHRPLHVREVTPALRLMTRHALLTYGRKHWPRWQVWFLARLMQLESRFRRFRSLLRGREGDAQIHSELTSLIKDVVNGRVREVRRRLRRTADELREPSASQDGLT